MTLYLCVLTMCSCIKFMMKFIRYIYIRCKCLIFLSYFIFISYFENIYNKKTYGLRSESALSSLFVVLSLFYIFWAIKIEWRNSVGSALPERSQYVFLLQIFSKYEINIKYDKNCRHLHHINVLSHYV